MAGRLKKNKAVVLTVRFTPDEANTVRYAANQAGVSLSEYVRSKLVADPFPAPEWVALPQLRDPRVRWFGKVRP